MDNNDILDENLPENEQASQDGADISGTMELYSSSAFHANDSLFTGELMLREKVTDLNCADYIEKTRLMDSVVPEEGQDVPAHDYIAENPVKKRKKKKKKKKKQTNHTRTFGQIFLGVLIAVVAIGVGAFLAYKLIIALMDFTGMAKQSREYEISITDDMGIQQIADELYENDIIEMPNLFVAYINFFEEKDEFLNGNFIVKSNMSYGSIVSTLQTVRTYTETVTVMIPEGSTAQDIGQILEANYVCRAEDFEKFYQNKIDLYDFEEGIDSENRFYCLEGYLFPDTYNFWVVEDMKDNPQYDTTAYAEIAAQRMYDNFEDKITRKMEYRMEELGLTLDEVIILASLIQKEGTNADNMALISSVFHNRLNSDGTFPQLQSDTTYTYIDNCIKPEIGGDESFDDIVLAYDTYQCVGLPAGAVCSPGLEAINAALYPAESSYYYFLASEDGAFFFAQTNEEHEQNIIDAELRAQEDDDII